MPKLAAVLDSLEGVAPHHHELYEQVDGKFVLDVDVEAHPATEGLRSAAKARLGEADELRAKVRTMQRTEEELRGQLATALPERDRLKTLFDTQELHRIVGETYLGAGGFEGDVSLVIKDAGDRFARAADGSLVLLDEKGEATDIAPADWFYNVYRNQRPKLFKGTGASGSGAEPCAGNVKPDTSNLTGSQMVNAALAG